MTEIVETTLPKLHKAIRQVTNEMKSAKRKKTKVTFKLTEYQHALITICFSRKKIY